MMTPTMSTTATTATHAQSDTGHPQVTPGPRATARDAHVMHLSAVKVRDDFGRTRLHRDDQVLAFGDFGPAHLARRKVGRHNPEPVHDFTRGKIRCRLCADAQWSHVGTSPSTGWSTTYPSDGRSHNANHSHGRAVA